MQSNISAIARKPYLTPDPGNAQAFHPQYQYSETTSSILWNDTKYSAMDLEQKFSRIDINLPYIIKLQDENLEPGPSSNIHDGQFPLFLSMLQDTSVHPYSLCPFPISDALDKIQSVIDTIFDAHVPPDRASWILQVIVKKSTDPNMNLTNIMLKVLEKLGDPSYQPDYMAKVFFYCYDKNILEHHRFLMEIISKLTPKSLIIFKNDIIQTHTVLKECLKQSDKINDFLDLLGENLIIQRTHLIQFAILYYYYQQNQQQENPYVFYKQMKVLMKSDFLKKRALKIFQIITPTYLNISTLLSNAIISTYPFFDNVDFKEAIERIAVFIPKDDCQEYTDKIIMDIIDILFWFRCNDNTPSLAAAISFVISMLSVSHNDFPLTDVINFFYEHVDDCERTRYLFIEMQKFGEISYIQFVKTIIQLGYNLSRPEDTLKIISSFPFVDRTLNNSKVFHQMMKRYNAQSYDDAVKEVYEADKVIEVAIQKRIELVKTLPFAAQYGMCSFMVDNCKNFSDALDILIELNIDSLIPELVHRLRDKNAVQFSLKRRIIHRMMHATSLVAIHGEIDILVEVITENIEDPLLFDFCVFLKDHYERYSANMPDLKKQVKENIIYPKEIMKFFRRYSYLCSLHTFDSFHSVDNANNFDILFKAFMSDLLQFRSLKEETFFDFFISFIRSGCISRPVNFFIKSIIAAVLSYSEEEFTERLESLLEGFFTSVFKKKLYLPSEFLSEANKKRGRSPQSFSQATKLVQLLIKIVKKTPEAFTPENCFNDHNVKICIQEPQLMTELIIELKKGPLPQITNHLLTLFDKSCSNPPITLMTVYFALLPDEARDTNFDNAFEYFVNNVTTQNCRFYAYWLKYYVYFNQQSPQNASINFPVLFTQTDKRNVIQYSEKLASMFLNLFIGLSDSEEDQEKVEIFLNAWTLICQTDKVRYQIPAFANAAIKLVADLISLQNGVTSMYIVEYLKPAILIPLVSMDYLVDKCFKLPDKEENYILAATVFVSYITHCAKDPRRDKIELAEQCLLKWLPKIQANKFRGQDFIIDAYNFIACFSSEIMSPDDISMTHNSLGQYFVMLPDDLKKLVLLNLPPQTFVDSKEPLFADVEAEKTDNSNQFPPPPPESDTDAQKSLPLDLSSSVFTADGFNGGGFNGGGFDDFTWF